jgi:hypothetical protein
MRLLSALFAAGVLGQGGHGSPGKATTTIRFAPVKSTVVYREPVLLHMTLSLGSASHFGSDDSIRGVWEYQQSPTSWVACERLDPLNPGRRATLQIPLPGDLRVGQTRSLGLVFLDCSEVYQTARVRARFRPEGTCCTSTPIEIQRVEGSDADRHARALFPDSARETRSVLAGYSLLQWQNLDRLYEDPITSYQLRSYLGVPADYLQESITELQEFLSNFPKFPFARSLRLRLATELAIIGRQSEALAQLKKITPSPIEPQVATDAARLVRELSSSSNVP